MLVETITDAQAAGQVPAGDPVPFVLTCWSCVHGLATLWLDGPLSRDTKGFGKSREKLAAMVTSVLGSVLASAAAAPPGARGPARAKRRAS